MESDATIVNLERLTGCPPSTVWQETCERYLHIECNGRGKIPLMPNGTFRLNRRYRFGSNEVQLRRPSADPTQTRSIDCWPNDFLAGIARAVAVNN